MNPLLQQTQAAILKKADPRLVPVINKLVSAGKTVMYSKQTRGMMIKQLGTGDDPELIGSGIAKLIGILYNQSKKTAPLQALIPAAVLLLVEGLDFLEKAGTVQISNDFLAECTMAMGSSVAQMFGATPEQLQGMVNKGKPAAPSPATPQPGILAQGAA